MCKLETDGNNLFIFHLTLIYYIIKRLKANRTGSNLMYYSIISKSLLNEQSNIFQDIDT